MSLLDVRELSVCHRTRTRWGGSRAVLAVDQVSFTMAPGERLGIVGESGCGKSTLCLALLGFHPLLQGDIRWNGDRLADPVQPMSRQAARHIQMVFQDPGGSLNPRMRVGALLDEALWLHGGGRAPARREAAARLLAQVGIGAGAINRFPHEFSGGQRQRIGIARALAADPRLLIADEPVSALDVCVQAQVIDLLLRLREERGFALLFVAHDLAVVRTVCERALVMYRGRLVEQGPVDILFSQPAHPYTRALLDAVPDIDRALQRRVDGPAAAAPPPAPPPPQDEGDAGGNAGGGGEPIDAGCGYRDHCPIALPVCRRQRPAWQPLDTDHAVACHRAAPSVGQRPGATRSTV